MSIVRKSSKNSKAVENIDSLKGIVSSVDSMADALIAKIDAEEKVVVVSAEDKKEAKRLAREAKIADADATREAKKLARETKEAEANDKREAKKLAREAKEAMKPKTIVIVKPDDIVEDAPKADLMTLPVVEDLKVTKVVKVKKANKDAIAPAVLPTIEVPTEAEAMLDKVMAKATLKDPEVAEAVKQAMINQGDLEVTDNEDEDVSIDDKEDEDLEIIEVSQLEVKTALKNLISRHNDKVAELYAMHDKYNNEFFGGELSIPLITIEKMSNKTLGSYNSGVDTTGIENHMQFNKFFIALNTETRISETVRHEMIHQYQDEILYAKNARNGVGGHDGAKRPKEWHNADFREQAELVGIPANGKHCTGNPAKMPEVKSYNRKFACGCVASNGHRMTIWSTREVDATCNVCGEEYEELKKSGGTIVVSQSDIERAGEDAVEMKMKLEYEMFENFQDKANLVEVVKALKKSKAEYKEGIYQKGHNAYAEGFSYWVAWRMPKDGAKND